MSSGDPSLDNLNTIPTSIMWIGAGITLLTTIVSSLGLSIQQRSYRRPFAKVNYNNIFSVLFEKYMWTIGFCIYILGSLSGSICSIGALPVTLLAPIGSFSLITNAIFAKLLLDDVWTIWSMLATLVILVGAFFIGFFGIIPESFKTVEELVELFARKEFIIYFTIQEVLIILILTWNTFNELKLKKFNTSKQVEHLPFPKLSKSKNDTIVGLIYGTMSIILSTQGVLFCKSGIQLIGLSIGGNNQFNKPFTWVIVIMLISVTLIQLYYFNMGIKYCDLVVLMPANYCVYTCFCLLNGLVYFNQWNMLNWWKLLLVALGSVILSVGVLLLSLRPKTKDQLTSKDSNGNPDQSQLLLSQNNLPIENLYSSNSEINDHYDRLIENSGAGEGDDYYGDMLDDLTLRLIEIHSTNNEGNGYEAQWNQISSTLNQEETAFDNESNNSGNSMDIL